MCVEELFNPWSWVCFYIMQQYSPDPSGLIEAVSVDLYVLVLSPHSVWEDPVLLGFLEIHMWCGSHLKWLPPQPPALLPSSFFRISLCLLMSKAFCDLHENIRKGKKKKKNVNSSSKQSEEAGTKQGDVWVAPTTFWLVFILIAILSPQQPREVGRTSRFYMRSRAED